MFYLHARRTLANVSSDYKHLTPNHTISFQNLLIHSFKERFCCTQPLRSKYAIIILIYIATTLPPQTYRTHSLKIRLLLVIIIIIIIAFEVRERNPQFVSGVLCIIECPVQLIGHTFASLWGDCISQEFVESALSICVCWIFQSVQHPV